MLYSINNMDIFQIYFDSNVYFITDENLTGIDLFLAFFGFSCQLNMSYSHNYHIICYYLMIKQIKNNPKDILNLKFII